MLRIAIVEDEADQAALLDGYVRRYGQEHRLPVHTTVYTDGDELVDGYKAQFDILLLDIEMPYLNGMDAAAMLRRIDQQVVIIFITNMAQYAIKGYEVNALDYLLKPVSYYVFSQRLTKAIGRVKSREHSYLAVPVKGGAVRLDVAEILYIESQGHTLYYHTAAEVVQSAGTLAEAEKKLEGKGFFRINKGTLAALEHITALRDGCAVIGQDRLLISRGRKTALMEALADFVGGTL